MVLPFNVINEPRLHPQLKETRMINLAAVSYPWIAIVKAVSVAVIAIVAASCMKEPERQKLMVIVLGVAAGAYLNGGFAFWEFPFSIAVAVCPYQGLSRYSTSWER